MTERPQMYDWSDACDYMEKLEAEVERLRGEIARLNGDKPTNKPEGT